MRCGTVGCVAVRWGALRYGGMRCGTVECVVGRWDALWDGGVRYRTVGFVVERWDALWGGGVRFRVVVAVERTGGYIPRRRAVILGGQRYGGTDAKHG